MICLDASVFINASHSGEKGASASRKLLARIKGGRLHSIISTITVAELLNGAYRLGPQAAVRMKRDLAAYKWTGSMITPLTEEIADRVGQLCAQYDMRIRPDVIIVASGLLRAATAVVTRDRKHYAKFQKEIPVLEPEDLLKTTS